MGITTILIHDNDHNFGSNTFKFHVGGQVFIVYVLLFFRVFTKFINN